MFHQRVALSHLGMAKDALKLLTFRPTCAVQSVELFIRQRDVEYSDILFQVRDFRRAWNGQHDWAALEHPCQRNLARSGVMGFRNPIQYRAAFGEAPRSQRKPRNKTNPVLLAVIQHVFAATIDEIVNNGDA